MNGVVCFYREPFFTYWGLIIIGIVTVFLVGSLLCVRFRFGLGGWLRMFFVALAALGVGIVTTKLFGMASRAVYLSSVGESFSLAELFRNKTYVFYGGLLGWFGGVALLLPRALPQRARCGWDIFAACSPLFHAIARLGCYCATKVEDGWLVWQPCCYGKKMDNAFCAHFWDSRLPTQLIESAFNFLLFAALLALLLRGGKKWRGKLPALYLVAYPVFRYIIEFFRDDAVRGAVGPFSFSQLISLLILVGVLVVSVLRQRGVIKAPAEDAEE